MTDHVHQFDSRHAFTAFGYSDGRKTGSVTLSCACGKMRTFSPYSDRQRVIKTDRYREARFHRHDFEQYVVMEPYDQGRVYTVRKDIGYRGCPYPDGTIEHKEWWDGYRSVYNPLVRERRFQRAYYTIMHSLDIEDGGISIKRSGLAIYGIERKEDQNVLLDHIAYSSRYNWRDQDDGDIMFFRKDGLPSIPPPRGGTFVRSGPR